MSGGYFDIDRVPFDGRPITPPFGSSHRQAHSGHGGRCSSNPEVGCVCGAAEAQSERLNAPCCHPRDWCRRNEDGSETCVTCGARAEWGFAR